MKTFVLTYNGFVQFEVVLACLFMKRVGDIITVGINENQVASFEGFKIKPDTKLSDVDVEEVDLFIIPGGDAKEIYCNIELNNLLEKLNERKKVIAAICSGPVHLAKSGVLKGKQFVTEDFNIYEKDFLEGTFLNENVVVDGNIITAKPNGYVDFAIELGKAMKIYKDDIDLKETIEFYKFFRDASI